ncbi:sigma-70 family RNA polymerase sigma factor [Nocardia thailandica]|uniref:sigma-70 family RNA polymerase sigma factor n=1 Tax=Nocardia thailandica TaxID=257275 RepID=UPI00030A483D|nr:sigma-70 family RNA polymerase sigma factor [Nocardia thailandica]
MDDIACSPRCAGLCTRDGLAAVLAGQYGLLHWRAVRALGDAGLAEHAVQETLLRAWRACAGFDARKGSLRTWLLAIEHNVVVDIVRARVARPGEVGWEDVTERCGAAPGAEDVADEVAGELLVADLLARLPESQRAAVVEVVLRDRAYQEVAADFGVPVGTVKTRVHYALRSLRRLPDVA